ncbi:MAG TPA: tRNA (cytidine(34)-2'-O)-methyltransferase [Polyangiaceae bacterium LLY-WYZ-15_(1-7)]|nr:tRNA methyltransferase [Myxococcales bacterium]MAT26567.1 tRNA methyltransferase [Sandaracinus sp.]HJK95010.1 tRNA (cytidine(34)-2'-O)-methyltransferase [Polyangiaceae bacterium LLY-WYZ-15_(1-7)]MBJ74848.1 tRNA methyltransferase [Sandaracinus sp.]HJL02449.1 tRNA (cytidine(34)-2'-O)-methyltransferase [Polyangiaceae bacterium LLY-WYZ-15_(1-7)]
MPRGPKLRARPLAEPLRIVLVEPEIPGNTGAAARTAAATQSALHLVGELGFRIDEQAVRRAGLDYWPLVDLHTHPDLDAFEAAHPGARLHLFTTAAERSYLEMDVRPGDALVFGKESVGLSEAVRARYPARQWAIPTLGPVRSLNLSNSVSIVVFEALRKLGAFDETFLADDAIGER